MDVDVTLSQYISRNVQLSERARYSISAGVDAMLISCFDNMLKQGVWKPVQKLRLQDNEMTGKRTERQLDSDYVTFFKHDAERGRHTSTTVSYVPPSELGDQRASWQT